MSSENEKNSLLKKIAFFDVFPFLCRLLGTILVLFAFVTIGFPPAPMISSNAVALLAFAVFFLCLPVAKKVSIGKLLTFEKEVREVKEEVKEFKSETREFLGVYSNMITAISNTVNNQVTVNLPSFAEAEAAKEDLNSSANSGSTEDKVVSYISAAGGDYNLALARIRMEIESNLRSINELLPMQAALFADYKTRPLTLRQLFNRYVEHNPEYRKLIKSFDYVVKVCNAAIHGQIVDEGHAHEAIYMGLLILAELDGYALKNKI